MEPEKKKVKKVKKIVKKVKVVKRPAPPEETVVKKEDPFSDIGTKTSKYKEFVTGGKAPPAKEELPPVKKAREDAPAGEKRIIRKKVIITKDGRRIVKKFVSKKRPVEAPPETKAVKEQPPKEEKAPEPEPVKEGPKGGLVGLLTKKKDPVEPDKKTEDDAEEDDMGGELDDLDIPDFADGLERSILETLDAKVDDLLGDFESELSLDLDSVVSGSDEDDEEDEVEALEQEKDDITIKEPLSEKRVVDTEVKQRAARPERRKRVDVDNEDGVEIGDTPLRERRVAYKIAQNFEKLPTNMRNELIKTLSKVDDIKVREDVVSAIGEHFKDLPKEVRRILDDLSKDRETRIREEVVFEIDRSFDVITPNIRDAILVRLSDDPEAKVREDVVGTICKHFNEVSPPVKEKLNKLARDKEKSVRDEVEFYLSKSDVEIPDRIKEILLKDLKGAG